MELLADHTELFKQFRDNPGLKKSAIVGSKGARVLDPAPPLRPRSSSIRQTGQGTDKAHIHPFR